MTLLKDSLPWKRNRTQILDRNAVEFADVAGYGGIIDDEERAKLIVSAVNNHEALVAALRDMMPGAIEEAESGRITFTPAMEAARKLLASLE